MGLEQAGAVCEHRPHHHETSYSTSSGVRSLQMSDISWAIPARYPVPYFLLSNHANNVGSWTEVLPGWLAIWTLADLQLFAAESTANSQALLVFLESPSHDGFLRPTQTELYPMFVIDCWMWENWFIYVRQNDWIDPQHNLYTFFAQ